MLNRMELFSASFAAPELPLGGFLPSDDPVQVRNITGLGPVKATITTSKLATGRNSQYDGSTSDVRNIVMTLGLNPDWTENTIASLRQILYRYLNTQNWCKLRFFSDHMPNVQIEGYVESFEENMFSEDPELIASIICPKPDFIDIDPIIVTGDVDDGTTEFLIEYDGNLETGFEFRVDRTVANPSYTGPLTVTLTAPGEEPQVFEVDPITIDTSKYFKLITINQSKKVQNIAITDGAITNQLQRMTNDSVWPVLKPGQNLLTVAADEDDQAWTLAYFNRFTGL